MLKRFFPWSSLPWVGQIAFISSSLVVCCRWLRHLSIARLSAVCSRDQGMKISLKSWLSQHSFRPTMRDSVSDWMCSWRLACFTDAGEKITIYHFWPKNNAYKMRDCYNALSIFLFLLMLFYDSDSVDYESLKRWLRFVRVVLRD